MSWEYEWRRRLCVAIAAKADEDIKDLWEQYKHSFRDCEGNDYQGNAVCSSPRLHTGCGGAYAIDWILFYAASMGSKVVRELIQRLDTRPNRHITFDGALAGHRFRFARRLAYFGNYPYQLTMAFAARHGLIARRIAYRVAPTARAYWLGTPHSSAEDNTMAFLACCRPALRENIFVVRPQRCLRGCAPLAFAFARLLATGTR